jgi:predicted RNase H-like HicB family nuclease
MMKKTKRHSSPDLKKYMLLPYRVVIHPAEDAIYEASIAELPGCQAHGATVGEAVDRLREVQAMWIDECLSAGRTVPLPHEHDDRLPSGRWLQRVPRSLHLRLAQTAAKENVSLNQLVTSILSGAVAERGARLKNTRR